MKLLPAPILAAVVLASAPQAAANVPVSSVDDLSVTASGSTLTAEGLATFGDASDSIVGTDVTGDARLQSTIIPSQSLNGLGMDLTSARIDQDNAGDKLVFTLGIADPIQPTFTIPELVAYHWLIKVTNGDDSIFYMLQAMRSGQYERTLPSPDPLFRVNSCGSLSSGAPNCFEVAGYVEGTMADGIVQWRVPAALIGAYDGAVVAPGAENGVYSVINASGAAFVGGWGDSMTTVPYVVGPAVHVGVRRATQDASVTTFEAQAALGPDGSFVGKIPVPKSAGTWVVSARACWGDIRGCATRDVQIVV